MDSGTGITGGGSGYAAILAHAGGVLYGTELGSVTLKRVGLFRFPIKHPTHTLRAACTRPSQTEASVIIPSPPSQAQAQAAAAHQARPLALRFLLQQ